MLPLLLVATDVIVWCLIGANMSAEFDALETAALTLILVLRPESTAGLENESPRLVITLVQVMYHERDDLTASNSDRSPRTSRCRQCTKLGSRASTSRGIEFRSSAKT